MSASSQSPDEGSIQQAAARWAVDRDRGLSSAESVEFELWLAADPRHAAAMRRAAGAWSLLDRVPDVVAQRELLALQKQRSRRRRLVFFGSLAAAATLAFAALGWWRVAGARSASPSLAPSALVATGPREVFLADGTAVKLNAGSEIVEEYEPAERRVRLTRGEAHFEVTKDKARPFIVVAGGVRVRAVGTAFNVNFHASRVEVLVTEGAVRVLPAGSVAATTAALATQPELRAGEYAVVETPPSATLAPAHPPAPAIVVTRLDPAAISKTLAWHENVVRLGGATLAELAAEFERRFGQPVRFAEPEIAQLRAGGRVPGDDPEAVARLLATTFDLEVDRAADGAWVLRKKKSDSR